MTPKGSTEVAIREQRAVAHPPGVAAWSSEQLEVIKATIAPNCTDAELGLFAEFCKRTGLDPFTRQVYAIKRKVWEGAANNGDGGWVQKMVIQTGIDGLRLIAERTGEYRGQRPIEWCGEDGIWTDVWLKSEPPKAARATILRADFEPMTRVALMAEYLQTNRAGKPTGRWDGGAVGQLGKCAEALGLRATFPNDLGGVYAEEEMPDETAEDRQGAALNGAAHGAPAARVIDQDPLSAQPAAPTPPPPAERDTKRTATAEEATNPPRSNPPAAPAPATTAEAPSELSWEALSPKLSELLGRSNAKEADGIHEFMSRIGYGKLTREMWTHIDADKRRNIIEWADNFLAHRVPK